MANHGGTEDTEAAENAITGAVIGAAIQVHRLLGPGLLEVVYAQCLCHELEKRRIPYAREVHLPIYYEGLRLASKLRIDLVVDRQVIVELKAVPALLPLHTSQLLTYLKLSQLRLGLLINFNVEVLVQGIRRIANGWPSASS